MIRGGRDEDEDRLGRGVWQAEAGPMQVRLGAGGWLVGEEMGDSVREGQGSGYGGTCKERGTSWPHPRS